MELTTVLVLSCGIWALLTFVILPGLKTSLMKQTPAGRIQKAGLEAFAGQLRDLAGVCAVTVALMMLALLVLQLAGWSAPDALHGLAPALGRLQDALGSFGEVWKLWIFLTLLGALLLIWYWSARKDAAEYVREHVRREIERLNTQREQDPEQWDDLPPTPEMEKLDQAFQEALQAYQSIGPAADGEPEETTRQRSRIEEFLTEVSQSRALLDYQRRIDMSTLDTQPAMPENARWYHYALRGLFSSGARRDAKAISKALALATAALTVFGMVGVQTDTLTTGLNKTINVLVVKHSKAEADRTWAQAESMGNAAPEPPPPDPGQPDPSDGWSADDQRYAAHLARHFAGAFSQSRILPAARIQPNLAAASRAQSVRSAILSGAEASPAAETVSESLTHLERELLSKPAAARESLESRLERLLTNRIRAEAEAKPGVWRSVRARVATHFVDYGKLPTMGDVHSQLLKETIGAALDAVPLDVSTETGKFARKILSDVGQDVIDQMVHAELRRAMLDMYQGRSMDSALGRVRAAGHAAGSELRFSRAVQRDLTAQLREEALEMELRGRNPSIARHADAPEMRLVNARSSEVLQFASDRPVRERLEALASYDDYFPGQVRAEAKTPLGRLEALQTADIPAPPIHGGGGGGTGTRPRFNPSRPAAGGDSGLFRRNFLRARNFRMVRGFARVGGVLIGREPANLGKTRAAVQDLTWRTEGSSVRLSLHTAKGAQELGVFPGSLVHRALKYAADGRVTTVTMVTAEPLQELKILLHPALVDTPIGCRLIELDRLVDTYARRDQEVLETEGGIRAEYALYALAWYLRTSYLLEEFGDEPKLASFRDGARKAVETLLPRTIELNAFDKGFPEDSSRSLLLSRPAYFDPALVRTIREVRRQSGDVKSFLKQLAAALKGSAKNAASLDRDTVASWLDYATRIEVWSGVREAGFDLDNDVAFLRRPAHRLWPFEFVLQVSFPDPPKYASEDDENPPFELSWIQPRIQTLVEAGLRSTGSLEEILTPAQKFAVLQRMFRVALDGGFSSEFPLEKLAVLSKATEAFDRPSRTLRWNVRPGSVAQLTPEARRLRTELNVAADERMARGCAPLE